MKRDIVRFLGGVGVVLLLALVLISGCTRSKSSEPPEATSAQTTAPATTPPEATEPPPTAEGSGDDVIAATTTAWAIETATAAAAIPEATEAAPDGTPAPTEAPEPTAPAPTEPAEPTQEPEPTEPPAATEPPPVSVERSHTVQPGENLFRIALSYGMSTDVVAAYNGIANPNFIYVGQELKIPPVEGGSPAPPPQDAGVHIVQPGENLFRIALQYNMTFTTLAAANNLSYPYTVYVGQRLIIP